jgi:hypothetical protein
VPTQAGGGREGGDDITDPALLETELARVRTEYNTVRLHQAIGYVTPDDEHHGRGEALRQRVPSCPRLGDSITHAVAEGCLEEYSSAPAPGDG